MAADPIHQFEITRLFTISHIGGQEIAFTNSSAYVLLAVAVISLLMIGGPAGRQHVPGRIQSLAEMIYEFVANTIRSTSGPEGMRFFPRVFSLFMFVLVSNVVGIIPANLGMSARTSARIAKLRSNGFISRRMQCWVSFVSPGALFFSQG